MKKDKGFPSLGVKEGSVQTIVEKCQQQKNIKQKVCLPNNLFHK